VGRPPRLLEDWRRLLDDARPDVAVVNPAFHRIGAVARECLERGIHVLAEKPLATSWEDYQALRETVRPDGPRLMAMLTMRFDGLFRAARRALAEGALGRPVLLSAQKSYPIQGWDGGPRPDFYRTRETYGGTMLWIGTHVLDLLRWFSGSEFASVGAAQTTLGNGGNGEMESAAALHLALASGAVAAAHVDFLRRRDGGSAATEAPGAAARAGRASNGGRGNIQVPWGDDRLRVACENGVLEVSGGTIRVEGPGGRREVPPDPDMSMFDAFLGWTAGSDPMDLSADDCLKAAEAALRARDAADTGRVQAF
jgi:predicted dehydrogenase